MLLTDHSYLLSLVLRKVYFLSEEQMVIMQGLKAEADLRQNSLTPPRKYPSREG